MNWDQHKILSRCKKEREEADPKIRGYLDNVSHGLILAGWSTPDALVFPWLFYLFGKYHEQVEKIEELQTLDVGGLN
jgi:hypothetical protein